VLKAISVFAGMYYSVHSDVHTYFVTVLDNILGEAASETGSVGLHVQLGDGAILDQHGEPLAAHVTQYCAQIKVKLQGLGQIGAGVSQHSNLVFCILILSPSLHDKGVVDRDADDLIDPLPLNLLRPRHVSWEMSFTTSGGKSSWNAENDDLLPSAELGNVNLVSGVVLEQVDGGDLVSNCNRCHFTHVEGSVESIARFE